MVKGKPSSGSTSFEARHESSGKFFGAIDPQDLQHNQDWLDAANITWRRSHQGKAFEGSAKELSDWGLNQMGWFNYNLPAMALDAAKLQGTSLEEKKAFLYMMDTYDDLKMSWAGAGRFIKGAAADPTNYPLLAMFGIGTAASQATRVASKEGVKSMLRAGIEAGVMGAVQAGVSDAARQSVEVGANPDQEFSMGRLAGSTAFGAAVGGVLGAGVDAGATALRGMKKGEVPIPKPEAPATLAPEAPTTNMVQGELPWSNEAHPQSGFREQFAGEPQLPGMDVPQPAPKNEINSTVEWQKKYSGTPEDYRPMVADTAQGELPLGEPPKGPFSYDKQGQLFPTEPDKFGSVKFATDASGNILRDEHGNVKLEYARGEGIRMKEEAPQAQPKLLNESTPAKANAAIPDAALLDGKLTKAIELVQKVAQANGNDASGAIIKAIKDAADPAGWSFIPGGRAVISESVQGAVKLLNELGVSGLKDVARLFEAAGFTPQQRIALQATINDASQTTSEALQQLGIARQSAVERKATSEIAQLDRMIAQLTPVQDLMAKMYLESSSGMGQGLALSNGHMLSGQRRAFASVEKILENMGIDPQLASAKERQAAFDEWLKQMSDFREQLRNKEEIKAFDVKIEAAKDAGDYTTAEKLLTERETLLDTMMDREGADGWTKFNRRINEWVISTVFTPATTIINTLPSLAKTIYKPLLNYLADASGDATIRGLTTQYSMMWNHIPFALKMAKAAFAYEKAMLTGDVGKFLEQTPEFKGQFGRILRTFPRILQGTDEFFFALNYHGFVAGEAMNQAIAEAERMGLQKGSTAYEAHLRDAVQGALKNAYSPNAEAVDALRFLRQQGMDRGLSGDGLVKYMQTELNKNEDLFIKASNLRGKDYTNDLLFRREFSGQGWESKVALRYEKLMNDNAFARIGFQLFIRTPIRVFEEGIRLTPGLQLIAPNFINDLKGNNGVVRQVRARGEAMMSMAFAGAVLSMYANGNITGGGAYDYKQQRDMANGGDWQPYTIYFGKGKTLSFRNLDPFATPMKIMLNALDKMQEHQYRKAQGEYLIENHNETTALLGIGAASVFQAIKDSGLTEGIDQLSQLITDFGDPEKHENAITKFFASKAQLAVPNVIGKTVGLLQGESIEQKNPSTFNQMLEARWMPNSSSVPAQRDALGYKRVISNPIPSYFGIGVNNLMERDIPEKHKEALKALASIDVANNVNFAPPTKYSKYFGDLDMREKYTPSGITWDDRINDLYSKSNVGNDLYAALVKNQDKFSWGSVTNKGSKLEIAQFIIGRYRDIAVQQFMRETPEAFSLYKTVGTNKILGRIGVNDVSPPPR